VLKIPDYLMTNIFKEYPFEEQQRVKTLPRLQHHFPFWAKESASKQESNLIASTLDIVNKEFRYKPES